MRPPKVLMEAGALKIGLCLLLATFGAALPQHKLSDVITHFEEVNYDVAKNHKEHQRFSRQWKAGGNYRGNFFQTISAFGRTFIMELQPDEDIFTKDAEFLTGTGAPYEVDRTEFVTGRIVREKGSFVHGSILNGRFRGIIRSQGEKYMIEAALAHFKEEQRFHSVMYRDSDVLHHKIVGNRSCASHPTAQKMSDNIMQQVKEQVFEQTQSRQRRQAAPANREKVECRINIAGDHTYANYIRDIEALSASDHSRIRASVLQSFGLFIHEANLVYSATTFLSTSSKPEGIRIAILTGRVFVTVAETKAFRSGTRLDDNLVSSNIVLTDFSKRDWHEYCLSYLFSHRDYDGGVLGLAYVGGICSPYAGSETRNTGIVTTLNSGRALPSLTAVLVFIHELGHNFGSPHDPAGPCQPSDSDGGKYLMFATATNGQQPNNRRFSPCTRTSIGKQLLAKAFVSTSKCFQVKSVGGEICGNQVKQGSEQCDCGNKEQCAAAAPRCCAAGCKLSTGSVCSNQDGPCCSDSCQFVGSGANRTCSEMHECRMGVEKCDGMNATCPRAASRPDGTVCNNKRFTCSGGECNASLCVLAGLEPCFCAAPNECSVCCKSSGACKPLNTLDYNSTGLNLNLVPGSPCQDYAGYCNFLNFCRRINDTGVLFQLTSALFSLKSFESAWGWAKDNWYYVVLGFAGTIVVFALIIHFGSKKTPRTVQVVRQRARQAGNVELRVRDGGVPPKTSNPTYDPL